MAKQLHVVRCGEDWKLKQDSALRSSGVFGTQREAIDRGRQIARNQHEELTVHATDGKIRAKWSYGNDPYPPKG